MTLKLTELNINGLFIIRNQAEVLNFLEKNPDMAPVLHESYGKIKEYFPQSNLTLDLLADADWPHTSHLIIWIKSNDDIQKALSTLEKMDEEWTYHLPDSVVSNLTIELGSF